MGRTIAKSVSVAFFLAIICSFALGKPVSRVPAVSVRFHAGSNKVTTGPKGVGAKIAYAHFDNKINKTGWSYLRVNTSEDYADHVQAYAAGVAEGSITRELTGLHWLNTMAWFCPKPYSSYCNKLQAFLSQNLQWMKEQIRKDKLSSDPLPYWHHVELFLYQAAGIADALSGVEKSPNIDINPMGFYLFQVGGDLEDLQSALGQGEGQSQGQGQREGKVMGSGHCSALIKLLPGNKDLYVSQDTWDAYTGMLRILKVYDFPWRTVAGSEEKIAGRVQSFSSSPGTLMSGDDFYLLSSGMATLETTIGNNNNSLWKFVTPQSVLEGIRSVVANRLAKSGTEWATIFQQHNSGTYNNEWMIVDYKKFQPGMSALPPGVLTVLDQIPGTIRWADLTPLLTSQRYFPSYNVAYFPEIFNTSGNWANVEKYGLWFSYNQTARALIFRRDHSKVVDIKSMTKLMRYNDFKHDPLSRCNCTPPYSAENAISARSDLNAKDGTYPFGALGQRLHGGIDMKLTSWEMFRHLSFVAQGGPTWDDLPPFQWSTSDFRNSSHLGQPDLWKFSPVLFNASAIFD